MTKQEKYKLKQEIKELICSDCDFLRNGICTNEASECSSDHEAGKFVKWLEMSNYYQLQSDEDGLISNDYICNHSIVCGGYSDRGICEDSETCYGIEEHKMSCKAQKALDYAELEEEKKKQLQNILDGLKLCGITVEDGSDSVLGVHTPGGIYIPDKEDKKEFIRLIFGEEGLERFNNG